MTEKTLNFNIFQEVQQRYNIVEVAQSLGIRVKKIGATYRADSIDTSGRGENALALYESTNSWYDFMLQTGGDVTDLVAQVKFGGDIKAALHELMPEFSSKKFDAEIRAKKDFAEKIEFFHKELFNVKKISSVNALKYLHSRGINDETINTLKIGVDVSGGNVRIRFPYWDESRKNVLYYTTRRFDWTGKGENEQEPKYKKAPLEQYPFLRNAPMGLDTLNRKKDDTLFITEGVFDFLAFYQSGYSVLSPNGGEFGKCWNEVIEKIKGFKRVVLAFDNDEAGQGFTYKAAKVLMKHHINFYCTTLMTKDVAEHFAVTGNLDAVINSVRQGYKWFIEYIKPKKPFEELTFGEKDTAMNKCKNFIKEIAAFTDSADVHIILMSIRNYFPKDFVSGLFEIARKGPSQEEIAKKISSGHHLTYNPRTGFHEYQEHNPFRANGIWKNIDDENVQSYIKNALGKFATGGKLSSILKLIKADDNVLSDISTKMFNTLPLFTCMNGTVHIDLETGEAVLKPHSPYDYTTVQLPFAYDEKADCKIFKGFIDDFTNHQKDSQLLLQEFSGYIALPHCKFQKGLLLKGGGSNGKSVFIDTISAVLGGIGDDGRGYVSGVEPSKLVKDFRLMPFRYSLVNISSETENDLRGAEGIIKKIIAGEVLEDSYKHKDPIPFKTRTKLIMACNNFPTISDTSDGFMRRWLIVELPMHYVNKEDIRPNTNDRELDPMLEDKLMKELPGIFNWMLEGLRRLLKNKKFTQTKRQKELIKEFRNANSPLHSFVEEKEEMFKGSEQGHIVPRNMIFKAYAEYADACKIQPIPANRFYSNMRSVFNSLSIPFDEDGNSWIFYYDYSKDEGGEYPQEE